LKTEFKLDIPLKPDWEPNKLPKLPKSGVLEDSGVPLENKGPATFPFLKAEVKLDIPLKPDLEPNKSPKSGALEETGVPLEPKGPATFPATENGEFGEFLLTAPPIEGAFPVELGRTGTLEPKIPLEPRNEASVPMGL